MTPALTIRGAGTSHAIYHGTTIIAGPYTSHGNATAALRGVERRLMPAILRRCLCCPRQFPSRGERLCRACREAG
ncbi:MAG: hypothetical protein V4712_15080 [Pseudomonadota bacterium]